MSNVLTGGTSADNKDLDFGEKAPANGAEPEVELTEEEVVVNATTSCSYLIGCLISVVLA